MSATVRLVNLRDLRLEPGRPGLIHVTLFGEETPTQNIRSGLFALQSGAQLDLHYHDVEEEQHVISGYATLIDSQGKEHELTPGTTFYCPPGPDGAHGIKNTGDLQFVCLYMYYAPGGKEVSSIFVENPEQGT